MVLCVPPRSQSFKQPLCQLLSNCKWTVLCSSVNTLDFRHSNVDSVLGNSQFFTSCSSSSYHPALWCERSLSVNMLMMTEVMINFSLSLQNCYTAVLIYFWTCSSQLKPLKTSDRKLIKLFQKNDFSETTQAMNVKPRWSCNIIAHCGFLLISISRYRCEQLS